MATAGRWLASIWPLVRAHLPDAPASVVDIGCGSHGGFVPMLRSHGYDAIGIDPEAPAGPHYRQTEFEHAELPQDVDAFVAATSLHHVSAPAEVIDRLDGTVIVVEWAWEAFDARTAEWCFRRLGPDTDPRWLHRRRDEWLSSGQDWVSYLRSWAEKERVHTGETLVRLLDERLERQHLAHGPYYFADLAATSDADEQAAIDAGEIQAGRIDWVGRSRRQGPPLASSSAG
jgi:methyltransferase family protein